LLRVSAAVCNRDISVIKKKHNDQSGGIVWVNANGRIEKETTEDMKGGLQHGMFMHVIAIFLMACYSKPLVGT
jgi:hypothetical protein